MADYASDEVAEDYKCSLEDLISNDRFQISNLTVIAKENTEHAEAISKVLENHIAKTPPQSKLPALYVVDSIVKNVGTPYTLFLGRKMYTTFMNAYTLVDSQTRRKLDEMLKTWKEPVPGSLDSRPVFSPQITRDIETALIKARTKYLDSERLRRQPEISRGRGSATPTGWQQTHPQSMPRANHYGNHGGIPKTSTPPGNRSDVDMAALHQDLERLIVAARADFGNHPFNPTSQQRLKSLLDLQGIMQRQQLNPEEQKLVRDQLASFKFPQPAAAPAAAPAPNPPMPAPAPVSTPPVQSNPALSSLLNRETIAELLKATALNQQPTPPPQIPNVLSHMPQIPTTATPQSAENPLIAALRLRGLLPPASAPPMMNSGPSAPAGGLPFLIPGQLRSTPPVPTPQAPTPVNVSSTIPMSTSSMKIPRVALIASLYEAKSNRCGTCGRRFSTTDEGREQKARHLDWHFKTNQRMVDASQRAQTRSWYVDEGDWIQSREVDDHQGPADSEGNAEGAAGAEDASKQGPPKQWIRAPNDAMLRNTPCPICQEKFESTWSEEVQDWIWQDAVTVNGRVYHASCYDEVTKDGPAPRSFTPQARTGTPDSVLGKRKAEGIESPGQKTRIKTEH